MATTNENLEAIASNVAAIAAESAKILEKGKQEVINNVINNYTGEVFDCSKYIRKYVYATASTAGLPILYLTGNLSAVTKDTAIDFTYKYGDTIQGYTEGTCTLKWQGNSSLNFAKKNYTFNKVSPRLDVGWGSQKKYVLKANMSDPSYARNVCTAKLWGNVVRSRTDGGDVTTKLKTLVNGGAVDGFPIMLVINNEYKGVYTFNIPKDDYLFGMGASDTEGFLCNESGEPATLLKGEVTKDGLLSERSGLSIGYVPDEDNFDWIVTSFNNMVNVVKDLDSANYKTVLANYIDVQSFIDSILFHCLTGNGDVVVKNSLIGTYNGVKWFSSVYDLDQAFGGHWQGLQIARPDRALKPSSLVANKVWWLIEKYDKALLKSRYSELRNGPMSEFNVYNTFSNFVVQIPRVLVLEENKIWNKLPLTGIDAVASIMDWYRLRCEYLDAVMAAL